MFFFYKIIQKGYLFLYNEFYIASSKELPNKSAYFQYISQVVIIHKS